MLTLEQVESNLEAIKNKLIEKKGERRVLVAQAVEQENKIKVIKDEEKTLIQSKQLLVDTVRFAREEAKYIIESLVTKSLQYVFEDPNMKFEIKIRDLKSRTECNFYIIEDGEEMDPLESNGGGVVDIISFILRIALIQASNKISLEDEKEDNRIKNEAPLILDEPFKHLSKEHVPKMGKFLREISEQFNMQIIIITHNYDLMKYADKRFQVVKKDNVSHVTEIIGDIEELGNLVAENKMV